MFFRSPEEYTEEIAEVRAAIKRIRKIGQQHSNSSGGASRSTQEADLAQLQTYLAELQLERGMVNGDSVPLRIGGGW